MTSFLVPLSNANNPIQNGSENSGCVFSAKDTKEIRQMQKRCTQIEVHFQTYRETRRRMTSEELNQDADRIDHLFILICETGERLSAENKSTQKMLLEVRTSLKEFIKEQRKTKLYIERGYRP